MAPLRAYISGVRQNQATRFRLAKWIRAEDLAQQQQTLGPETLVTGFGEIGRIGARRDQPGRDLERMRRRLPIAEVAGVGHDFQRKDWPRRRA